MAPVKTNAVVLSMTPYRESSAIVYLFSSSQGLVHGIAKGIRRQSGKQAFLERGFLIETVIYIKPGRELQTIGATAVVEAYPSVRGSLMRSALRDTAFEAFLSAVKDTGAHPELYLMLEKFLLALDKTADRDAFPAFLWYFFYRLAALLGVAPELQCCVACGVAADQLYLSPAHGGTVCSSCRQPGSGGATIPVAATPFISGRSHDGEQLRSRVTQSESHRITRALAEYCRYHFDVVREYRSLAFIESISGW